MILFDLLKIYPLDAINTFLLMTIATNQLDKIKKRVS